MLFFVFFIKFFCSELKLKVYLKVSLFNLNNYLTHAIFMFLRVFNLLKLVNYFKITIFDFIFKKFFYKCCHFNLYILHLG